MPYKKVNTSFKGDTLKFEAPGDSVEGILDNIIVDVPTQNGLAVVAEMTSLEGIPFHFFMSTALKSFPFEERGMIGKRLLITYTGDVQGKKGRPYKNFDIEAWEDEFSDEGMTVEKEPAKPARTTRTAKKSEDEIPF